MMVFRVARGRAVPKGLGRSGKWVSDGGHPAVGREPPALPCASGFRELDAVLGRRGASQFLEGSNSGGT